MSFEFELALLDHQGYCSEAPLFEEEELPMTLTLGMLGCDGWLLAADRRLTEMQFPVSDPKNPKPIRHYGASERKIFARPDLGIWYASAGSDRTREAGEVLTERIEQRSFNWKNPALSLRKLANEYSLNPEPWRPIGLDRLLIILDGSKADTTKDEVEYPQLWVVDLAISPESSGSKLRSAVVKQGQDLALGGDWGNGATLFPQLYYARCSVERLIRLAAFTILFASTCSPESIGGRLDILVGRRGEAPRFVSESELDTLHAEFSHFDETIAAGLGFDLAEVQKSRLRN